MMTIDDMIFLKISVLPTQEEQQAGRGGGERESCCASSFIRNNIHNVEYENRTHSAASSTLD